MGASGLLYRKRKARHKPGFSTPILYRDVSYNNEYPPVEVSSPSDAAVHQSQTSEAGPLASDENYEPFIVNLSGS
jgi:hypothetical protein